MFGEIGVSSVSEYILSFCHFVVLHRINQTSYYDDFTCKIEFLEGGSCSSLCTIKECCR